MATGDEREADAVTISVEEAASAEEKLELTYLVENGGGTSVYLVNRLFHRGSSGFLVDPDLVYSHRGDPGSVHLKKQLIIVPDTVDVEAPEVPYLSQVGPGESYRERLSIALPVAPHDPYARCSPLQVPEAVDSFVFSLGFFPQPSDEAPRQMEVATGGSEWFLDYTRLAQVQTVWSSPAISAGLTTTIPRAS